MAELLRATRALVQWASTLKRSCVPVLAALLAMASTQEVRATHAMGGEMSYTCLGNNRYLVTLNFYRDCRGVAAPTNCNNGLEFRVRSTQCNANFTQCFGTNPVVQVITPICPTEVDRCVNASGTYGVQRYTYTRIVDLTNYAGCGSDWVFSWALCCRNNAITSLNDPGNQDLYLDTRLNNTNAFCNNSPTFTNLPTPFYCLGQQISYNPGAVDADGDSLVYALIPARGNGGNNINYNANYSAAQPIRNTGGANAVVLDPQTGTMTVTPSIQQVSVVSYRVREYRAGVLVGETTRDIQFVIRACADNAAPTASGMNGTGTYSMQVCAGTPVNFTINSNDVNAGQAVTMNWNGGITGATFTTSGSPFPTGTFSWTPTVADIGNHVFTVNVFDNACPLVGSNDFGYSILVTPPNTPANAGPDRSVCSASTTLEGVLPYPGVPGTWSVVTGTGVFSDASSPTSTVSGLSIGVNEFRWTLDFLTCGTTNDVVRIIRHDPAHAAANAGPDQSLCLTTNTTTLAANTPTFPATGQWTQLSGSGVIASPTSPTTTVTGLVVGVNRFRWTINNGPCGNTTDEVIITMYSMEQGPANAGPDQNICTPTSMVTMAGNPLVGPATGQWALVSGAGGTITNPGSPTTTITGLPVGVHTYSWTINNGPCLPPTTTDEVVIRVYSSASPTANAGPGQQLCSASSTTLAGSVPIAPAAGTWTVVSGTGVFSNANAPNTTVSGLSFGSNVFMWTVNNGVCASSPSSSQVTIVRYNDAVNSANAGPDQALCTPNTTATMAANPAPAPASGLWTLVAGSGTITTPTSATTTITDLQVGVNTFRWNVTNGPCPVNPPNDDVTILVYDQNAPAANAGPDQSVCLPLASVTLAGNAPVASATGQWTVVSGTANITTPTSPTSTITGLVAGVVELQWTINNGPCANPVTSDRVLITVFSNANLPAAAGADQELCTPNTSTTLTGSALITPATGTWTLVSGFGTIVSPSSPTTLVTGLAVGDNIFRWSVSNGACPGASTNDEVRIRVFNANNPAANAGPDQTVCSTSPNANLTGSSLIFPATGHWEVIQGTGVFGDANSPTTTITGLALGTNRIRWSVSNGPCPNGTTNDEVVIVVFDASVSTPDAGPDQQICIPTFPNIVTMAGSAVVAPATGTWTVVSGGGTITAPNDPLTTITNMPMGVNVYQWVISNGPCPLVGNVDVVTVSVFDAGVPPAHAGPDQEICTPISTTQLAGSALGGPAVGEWTLVSGTGVFTDPGSPTTGVTGLTEGQNIFRWTVNNGPCAVVTSDDVVVSVFDGDAQQAQAGPDQDLCSNSNSTTLAANAAVGLATAQWSLVSGTATFANINDPHTAVTGLGVGVNVLAWTINNGACGNSVDQVVIRVFSANNPVANAGPDQQLCTPNTATDLSGSSLIAPATGTWTLVSGQGNILSANSPSTQVTGLAVGANVFRWTVNNGPCPNGITFDEVTIVVFNGNAQVAQAGADQEICDAPAVPLLLAGNAPSGPATGTWSLGGTGTAVFADASLYNTTVTGLSVGDNILVWTLHNGVCGSTSDEVLVRVYDNDQTPAAAGVDQQLCTPQTSTTMAGNSLIAPATGHWALVSGGGTITDAGSPTTTITDLPVGVNVFRWTVGNGPCWAQPTTDEVVITVYDHTVSGAGAGPDQEICTPTTSVTMNASAAPFPAEGSWSLITGSGTITMPNAPNTTITDLTVGTHVFRWSVSNGACPVNPPNDDVTIKVYDGNAPAADAGPDQEVCSPAGTLQLAGNAPVAPATGQWTVLLGQGVFADANDPNTTVSGAVVGENIYQWTINNGACSNPVTRDAVSVFVFDVGQPAANAGPDQELCTPNTSTDLAGSALTFPATGTWTFVQGGGTITDPSSPTTTVTDLLIGENILRWTVSNGPCANGVPLMDEVSLFVFDGNLPAAHAGPDQAICSPTSSVVMSGSPVVFPAVGTWTLVSGTANFVDVHDPNTTVTGLGVGAVTVAWTITNGPCSSGSMSDQVTILIYDGEHPDANAGPDQEICTPQDAVVMAGSPVTFPATGHWTVVSGTANIVDPTNPATTINDLTVGVHEFEWTIDNGPCPDGITSDRVVVKVFDENNPVANAGPDQELCTPVTSALLAGSNVIAPAEGTWSMVSGTGVFADAHDPHTTVSGLSVGINVLRWTVNNGPCASGITVDEMTIVVFSSANPVAYAGPDQSICTPDNDVTLAGSNIIFPATGQWTVVSGGGVITDPSDPNTSVTGLGVGEHIFQWSVLNGPCANGSTSDLVTVLVFDATTPVANAGVDQQVCTPLTGTTLAGSTYAFPATGTWTLVSGAGLITDAGLPNTTVTDLGVGPNVFRWTVNNGPCGAGITTDDVTITLFDLNAPPAAAGADQSFCDPAGTVTMAGNIPTPPAIGVWSAVEAGITINALNNPATTASGFAIGETHLVWMIDNGICGVSRDTMSVFVFDPNNLPASAGLDQEYCTPQDSTWLQGNTPTFPATGQWSVIDGAGLFADASDPGTKVVGLAIGANTFVWTTNNGPCPGSITSDTITVVLYSDSTDAAFAGDDFQVCLPVTSATLAASVPLPPATGVWSVVSGPGTLTNPADPHTTITGLVPGITVLAWDLDNGPCPDNGIMSDTLVITIYDPFAPLANAGDDVSLCTPEDSLFMAASVPPFPGIGTWSVVSGAGTFVDPNAYNSLVTDLAIGVNEFTWFIYNGDCPFGPPSIDTVKVVVYDNTAPIADAGADQSLCTTTQTDFTANAATFPGTGHWSLVSGTGTFADSANATTGVSGLSLGVNTFLWTIDNGPCGITQDTVRITVFDGSLANAQAGADAQLCTPNTSLELAANAAALPATGHWTVLNGGGVLDDATDPTATVSGLTIGTNTLEWTIENGPCGNSTDQIVITVFDSDLTSANAGADQEHCSPMTSTTLAATAISAPASGTWTILSGGGSLSDATDPAATLTFNGPGTYVLQWGVVNGPCAATALADTVVITLFDSALMSAQAGDDIDLCSPSGATVQLNAFDAPAPATTYWSVVQGNAVITDPDDPGTSVTGVAVGVTELLWTVENGACGSSSDALIISVYDPSEPAAFAGEDRTFCHDTTSTHLAANAVVTAMATGTWSRIAGSGELVTPGAPNTEVTGLALGDNIFVWTVDNGACGTTHDTVVVHLKDCTILVVPDAFSPNGDGVNDTYVVRGLEYYGQNTFQVFNRWGSTVLDRKPYRNDWDGRSENSMNWGEELPEGTYYFILDPGKDKEVITGYIYLRR